jgi:hypothetical protein
MSSPELTRCLGPRSAHMNLFRKSFRSTQAEIRVLLEERAPRSPFAGMLDGVGPETLKHEGLNMADVKFEHRIVACCSTDTIVRTQLYLNR